MALGCFSNCFGAEKIIWNGEVNSNGNPTEAIPLQLFKKYQIKASGYVNLGKWIQNHQKLANDACYEFSEEEKTEKLEALKNSNEISICDNKFHPDHVYQSEPFVAEQDRIHFWVYDTRYDDNSGLFKVQIIEIE
jgi:hypothetical protein